MFSNNAQSALAAEAIQATYRVANLGTRMDHEEIVGKYMQTP